MTDKNLCYTIQFYHFSLMNMYSNHKLISFKTKKQAKHGTNSKSHLNKMVYTEVYKIIYLKYLLVYFIEYTQMELMEQNGNP